MFRRRTKKKKKREELKRVVHTGIGLGNGGGAGEVTGARSHSLALVVTVESVRGVSLDSVREVTQPIGLDWNAVGAGGTCIVQGRLESLVAGITPRHAPSCCGSSDSGSVDTHEEEEEEQRR